MVFLMVVLESRAARVHLAYLEQLMEIQKLIMKVPSPPRLWFFFSFLFFCYYETFKRLYRKKKSNHHHILCFIFIKNFVSEHKYIYVVVISVCVLFCVQPFLINVISCTVLCIPTLGFCYTSRLLCPFVLSAEWYDCMLVQTRWYRLLFLLDDLFGVCSQGKITESNGMNGFGAPVTYFLG